jgi:hypothetical protein
MGLSNTGEVVREKVPWIGVIVLSVFLGAFGITWLHFLPSTIYTYYNFGEILCTIGLTSAPFIVLIFTALYSRLTKTNISLATLTYLYVIAYTTSWFVSTAEPANWYYIVASRHSSEEFSSRFIAWYMAPTADITREIVTGHVAIPWGDWIPSTIYHWLFSVLLGTFLISISTLFRRLWVDTERLPFPQTLLAYELVRRFPEEKESLIEKLGRPFLLGIVLGLAYQIPIFMTVVFPWFPDIYGWKTLCLTGYWYVVGGTDLAKIAGLTTVNEHPVGVAIGYILPLSITFNVWFWYLIWLILMQVSYALGYYTGIENSGGCGRTGWCSPSGMIDPPLMMNTVTYSGGLLGLTVMALVLNRKYILETLRLAFRRESGVSLEIEKDEALSYKNTYLLLGSSTILMIALFFISGMGIASAILMVVTYFLFLVAYARIFSLTGLGVGGITHGNTLFRLFMYPKPPDPMTTDYVMSAYYSLAGLDNSYLSNGSIFTGFSSYKMASLTKASNSSVLKVMLAATVIVPLTTILTVIWLSYTFGGSTLPGSGSWFGSGPQNNTLFDTINPERWTSKPSKEPVAPYVLVGFVIVAILDFLHARFVWFPLSAIGFVVGMSRLSIKWGYWGPFLVAWVLKFITLRVGGSKLYERIGVPISGGFVTGYVLALLFGGTMGVIRFFIPY